MSIMNCFLNSYYNIFMFIWVDIVGTVDKISAFQPKGSQIALLIFENLCDFFSTYANSAFHPSGVGKQVAASAGS